jgi:pyruvate, water dikinase
MDTLIKKFKEIRIQDITTVGGKNASLGEMFNELSMEGVKVPDGFATTAEAFRRFLQENNLEEPLEKLLEALDRNEYSNLSSIGARARDLIMKAEFFPALSAEILNAYEHLGNKEAIAVAVRSSATAEDLPNASFAGQHDTYLNIVGVKPYCRGSKNVLLLYIQTGRSNTGRIWDLIIMK